MAGRCAGERVRPHRSRPVHDLLREIGDRVWRQGGEQITIRLVGED